jgi:hypothetical protein
MLRVPPDNSTEFARIKNERLLFVLHLVREVRCAFEAVAASKWLTLWIVSAALGGSSWIVKTHLFP